MATLTGRVALVSGSSQGLGAAIARELSNRGASVVINYPHPNEKPNADKVLQSLGGPSRGIAVEADLSTPDGPQRLADAAANAFGSIDFLVNCAGVHRAAFLDDPDDARVEKAWNDVMNLNGRGIYFLTRAVLKHLTRGNSRIVNIGSSISRTPAPESSIYAASKGIAETFTKCWATELPRKYGCTVNTVAPGPVATEAFLAAPSAVREALQPVVDATPAAARLGTPEEVAWVVAGLCEEQAGWVNGAYIPVNGGSCIS